jgi:hypothetical protein
VIVEPDPLDRELQSRELARIMAASYPRPVVFLGYVVTKPHALRRKWCLFMMQITLTETFEYIAAPYQILVEDGRMHDIDKDDEDRW